MVTSGDVFCHNLRGVGAPGMCWVEARDDAEHPTTDGTALTTKNPAQGVNDAEVEKSRITTLIYLFLEKSKAFPLALLSLWKAYPLDPTAAWSLSSPLLKWHPLRGSSMYPNPSSHIPTPHSSQSLLHLPLCFSSWHILFITVLSPLFLLWKEPCLPHKHL